MVLNQLIPKPIPDLDNSTIYTPATPPETVVTDLLDDLDPLSNAKLSASSVPWPDSTFLIRSISSGHVITLRDGQVVLAPPGGRGSIHWACVETKGWLGFRNCVSGTFLGHDMQGRVCCSAKKHQGWENFCVRPTPEGGFVLLMTHFERLWYVGIVVDQGVEKLAKLGNRSDALIWEFTEVKL
jgi:hypothetical protein